MSNHNLILEVSIDNYMIYNNNSIFNKLILIAFPVALLLFLAGWSDSWEGIKKAAGRIDSVHADFVQEKHLPILARPLVSKGVFYYRQPDALRWEYTSPVRSILIMHQGDAKRYIQTESGLEEDAGQGLSAMQFVLPEIAAWLSGRFDDNPMFTATLEKGPKIVLTPKTEAFSKIILRIELLFADQPGVINTVTIFENEIAFTRIVFKNTTINQPIPDSLFKGVK